MSVLSQSKARAAEKTFDQKRFITEPAKQAPKVVAGARKEVQKVATGVDTAQKMRPTCKKRPDSKKPSSRGSGKAREFVPWCR